MYQRKGRIIMANTFKHWTVAKSADTRGGEEQKYTAALKINVFG